MGPKPNTTNILIRKETDTQGEHHVMTEAETGVIHSPAREHEGLQAIGEVGEGYENTLP